MNDLLNYLVISYVILKAISKIFVGVFYGRLLKCVMRKYFVSGIIVSDEICFADGKLKGLLKKIFYF